MEILQPDQIASDSQNNFACPFLFCHFSVRPAPLRGAVNPGIASCMQFTEVLKSYQSVNCSLRSCLYKRCISRQRWHAIGSSFFKLYVMKRITAVCTFILMALLTSVFSFAQSSTGTGSQMGDQATHAAQMKQKLMSELKMTEMQADSVVAINMSYRPQMRDIFQDQSLSQDEKKSRMKAV